MPSPQDKAGFTGKRRSRKTRPSLIIVDRVARALITLGGIGTILAVALVCVFLVSVVVPLFVPESLSSGRLISGVAKSGSHPIHVGTDEHFVIGWSASSDGTLRAFRLDNGQQLSEQPLVAAERKLTAWSISSSGEMALGFADGSIQLGQVKFTTSFIEESELTDDMKKLAAGSVETFQGGMLERTPEGQFRLQQLKVKFEDPVVVKSGVPIRLIDLSVQRGESASDTGVAGNEIVALLTDDGELRIARVKRTTNILTKKVTTKLTQGAMTVELPGGHRPKQLKLSGLGDCVYLAWDDGRLKRVDTRVINQPELAEELDVVPGDGKLTSLGFLVGKTSLLVGDSLGRVAVWFRVKPEDAQTSDGSVLRLAHSLPPREAAVTAITSSLRSRMVAAGYADGTVGLFHVTSDQQLAQTKASSDPSVMGLALSPKDDALVALTKLGVEVWKIDAPHPEATVGAMFSKVWYEGYETAEHVWQSSSGTDDFEPKYGLAPLIFGTIKATFYSMLFGAPLALLAAIYTSEFLHPRTKARVKPTIEIMASLPSVVLGFLAALVIAPVVEDFVSEVMTLVLSVPFAVLLGAYLWQLLPPSTAMKYRHWRIPGVFVTLAGGFLLASFGAPVVERMLFAGDVRAWLDGQVGSSVGGWMWLLTPVSGIVVALLSSRWLRPVLRRYSDHWNRPKFVWFDLFKFFGCCLATLALAGIAGLLLDAIGWDLRGTLVDTYVQRNAMIVGFIMGFAIIPIIYTISDDALSSVPESLRAASLGAGATPWQTAVRVIIPTALSGLFSAMMIGLGRAVGETMIVLMAAGNTPVMEWNVFNGFRTLSANIAVELPEAVRDSTHYRMLFLAALSLFALTFVLNTIAEVVRLRFRKRAFQL